MSAARSDPAGDRWERVGRRIVHWSLLGIAVTVTYCWCVRISDDLSWDEAASYRRYAHHPLTAGAYIHDSNNHPGDSLFRSLVFGVLGLDWPAFYRFAGFLILLGFLAAAWRWHRFLTQRGATFAATVLTLLLFQSHAVHEQAVVLRGYFPTIALEVVYFLLVARWSGILDRRTPGADEAAPPPSMTRAMRLKLAALSGVMLFVLQSNVVLMLILWPATAMAFGSPEPRGKSRMVEVLRESTKLGLLGAAGAAILYLPIFITLALGSSTIVMLPIHAVVDVSPLVAIRDEILLVFQQCQPGPFREVAVGAVHVHPVSAGSFPDWVFGALAAALLASSLLHVRRRRGTQMAWCLILLTLGACAAIAAINETPPRIRAPFVGPMIFAFAFMLDDLASRWSLRTQVLASLIAVGMGYAALVAPVRATAFDRRASDLAVFIQTYTRPAEQRVLVAHDNAQTLRPYLHRTFGDQWTLDSMAEVRQRLSGVDPIAVKKIGELERWVTDRFFPAPVLGPIRVDEIDVLVLVGQKETHEGAILWTEPSLDALKKRLSRMSHFRRDSRDIEIYERP